MDLPPTIPTSFVPQPASAAVRRFRSDFTGAFGYFAYGVLGIVFLLALGVFAYGRILANQQASEDAMLAKAEAAIDPNTVVGFTRLRDRLNFGSTLLSKHVAFSGFFTLLETILPTTVRFTTLHLTLDDKGNASLNGAGIAESFNALAATSAAFAADGHIKDAIFSNITVNKDNTVSFSISAALDPKLITFSP
ncbi:MAG: hypothetical protein B7W98_00855 [Parcubacteria group bacterium 20-58-5]|nr:MAG: hypothetical protein B7W98_00855 [Parcubacteria group bacterium 20-58-5]OYV63428.1 MAG: hypothetical protein B7X03_01965 [Parcubacteria group bacterium 21-58-10]HQT83026.1 hypothetical protein [Candidatus Paceibacterota bacterium]